MKRFLKTIALLICFLTFGINVQAQRIYALHLQGVQTPDNAILGDWLDTHFYGAPAFTSAQLAHHILAHPAGMTRGYIAGPSYPFVPGASLAGLPPLGCNDFGDGC